MAQEWDIAVGQTLRRTDMQKIYGGGQRGGMEPSALTPNVLLFTTPSAGEHFGYTFDGWHEDGTFHYTGEGQAGDQVMTAGNKATLEHGAAGRALRLFLKDGVNVTYVGEFEIPDESYVFLDEAPDKHKDLRAVFVFRLVPVGQTMRTPDLRAPDSPLIGVVSIEAMNVDGYISQRPDEPVEVVRREAELVKKYVEWLHKSQGQEAVRHKIPTPAGALMFTDVFNLATDELIEAKGSASRHNLRTALGQVLDYARFVRHERLAILLPTRPADEMIDLLHAHGVTAIWESLDKAFLRSDS